MSSKYMILIAIPISTLMSEVNQYEYRYVPRETKGSEGDTNS